MRVTLVVAGLLLASVLVWAADEDLAAVVKHARPQPDLPDAPILPVVPAGPLPPSLGERAVWMAQNVVRPDGWQLTGYSVMRIHDDQTITRWKFGIINPEIEAWRYVESDPGGFVRPVDRINQRERGAVIGLSFVRTF